MSRGFRLVENMKATAISKRLCESCKIVKRKNVVRVICKNPRHKQRQGQGWSNGVLEY